MKGAGDGGNGIKYIGQHVFDFVSSFRNTVNIGTDALDADLFLNDLSNLTSSLPADGKVLHIDSNNKVGFRTFAQLIADLGGGDITSVSVTDGANEHTKTSGAFALIFTAGDGIGLGLTGSSTGATNGTLTISVPDSGIDASAKLTNAVPVANGGTGTNTFAANGILVGNGTGPVNNFGSKFGYTDSDTFSIVADTIRVNSANDGDPQLNLINSSDGLVPPSLNFTREPADNAGADNDEIGQVNYVMDDSAGNATTFVQTNGLIDVATDGQESGRYVVQVASHDAELQIGLDIVGGSAEDEIDVTIASGAASVTTIEGTLTMGSTATLDNSGVLQTAAQTNITSVGTLTGLTTSGAIELGHASDTTIARSAAGKVTIEGNEIQTTNVHHHFLNAGFFLNFPFSRYIPLNGSLVEQNTTTLSPEFVNFTWPYDGFVKKMMLRSETDMGSTELKLYKGASGATVTTAMGAVTQTVDANNAVEFDFTSVTNTYSKGETMAVRVDPTDDPDGGQNITIELVFDLTT